MTREAILHEIQALPDHVLEALWRMIILSQKNADVIDQMMNSLGSDIEVDDFWEEAKSYISKDHPELNNSTILTNPKPGIARGEFWMSDDFDEPLDEMKEYMY